MVVLIHTLTGTAQVPVICENQQLPIQRSCVSCMPLKAVVPKNNTSYSVVCGNILKNIF